MIDRNKTSRRVATEVCIPDAIDGVLAWRVEMKLHQLVLDTVQSEIAKRSISFNLFRQWAFAINIWTRRLKREKWKIEIFTLARESLMKWKESLRLRHNFGSGVNKLRHSLTSRWWADLSLMITAYVHFPYSVSKRSSRDLSRTVSAMTTFIGDCLVPLAQNPPHSAGPRSPDPYSNPFSARVKFHEFTTDVLADDAGNIRMKLYEEDHRTIQKLNKTEWTHRANSRRDLGDVHSFVKAIQTYLAYSCTGLSALNNMRRLTSGQEPQEEPAPVGIRLTCGTCCRWKNQKGTQTHQSTATDRHLLSSVSVGDAVSVYTCFPRIRTEYSRVQLETYCGTHPDQKRAAGKSVRFSDFKSTNACSSNYLLRNLYWKFEAGERFKDSIETGPLSYRGLTDVMDLHVSRTWRETAKIYLWVYRASHACRYW